MAERARPVEGQDVGRSCPYCRFALKAGVPAVRCPECDAVHHEDCWDDNGGCAIVGCAEGPDAAVAPKPPPVPGRPVTGTSEPIAGPQAPPVQSTDRGRRVRQGALVVVGVLVVAAAGGVAGALALRGEDDGPAPRAGATVLSEEREPAPEPSDTGDDVGQPKVTVKTVSSEDGGTSDGGGTTGPGGGDDAAGIQRVLLGFHRAVVRGDYRGAWALTSDRYQRFKLNSSGGYAAWERHTASLKPYLEPEGLEIEVLDLNQANGVATVRVTDMGWTRPGSRCSKWEGITWAQREGSTWRYEPGYSLTPNRRAEWEPQADQLLGVGC